MRGQQTSARRERGAVGLEYGAIIAVAALVVGLITVSVTNNNIVSRSVQRALCVIFTLGQGNCGSAESISEPTEPCVTKGEGYALNAKVDVAFFAAGGSTSVMIETLSNGQYRVTRTSGSNGGVQAGAGFDAHLGVNGSQWGWDGQASASAVLQGDESQVWVVDSHDAAQDIRDWAIYDQSADTSMGGGGPVIGWISNHTVRPLSDWVAGHGGLHPPRDPDTVIYTGGASVDASAQLTLLALGAEASVGGASILGMEVNADGSYTLIGTLEANASISGSAAWETTEASTNNTWGFRQSYDADGNLVSVSYTNISQVNGDSIEMTTLTLPINTTADKDLANTFLYNPIPTTWEPFMDAARTRGTATKLTYDNLGSLDIEAAASGKLLAGLGVAGGFSLPKSNLQNAQYYNGTAWVPWTGCKS